MNDQVQRVLDMADRLASGIGSKCQGDNDSDCQPCNSCIREAKQLNEAIYQLRWSARNARA